MSHVETGACVGIGGVFVCVCVEECREFTGGSASSYDWGRCCLMISLDCGGILSGKRTENSTMRSPRCDGFLGKGRPSPRSRLAVPGLMMSWQGSEMMRFSSVGMLTVQPHSACEGGKSGGKVSVKTLPRLQVSNRVQKHLDQ